ncbi:MAG: hypothetical protein KIT72_06215 [Polyangiaceae bacterium]|nr:hypothetical protein [Polyangiaceae bacterium]MCW5789995.1 hypothetical protein [Polyangiaceae bacterium]
MESVPPLRSLAPTGADRDAYDDLLTSTRGLQRDQRAQRDFWFMTLPLEAKDDVLFELEVLLKSAACFANPRNHPGPPRRSPVVAQDFRQPMMLVRDGLHRAVDLQRQLLGTRDRALVFQRYLETVIPEDSTRTRLVRTGETQSTPEESLVALRTSVSSIIEIVEGTLRAPRVPFRLFYSVLATLQRDIGRNVFFNPLTALEFRPEFDRIKNRQVIELIRSVPGEEAHRLVALTFLSLFRMLRYLRLLERGLIAPRRRGYAGRTHLVLSVLRSDARALSDYLRRRSGSLLADSFERDLFRVPAGDLAHRAAHLRASGHRLLGVKSALEGIAGNLRLEMRRAFHHDLPPPDTSTSDADLRDAVQIAVGNLRPAIRGAILFLGKALGVSLEDDGVFDDEAARRETSERLRRDIWMFAQIVRAFSSKAQHTSSEDRWAPVYNFQFVREFLAYFRAMGYPLLRASDYPRFDTFMYAMSRLEDTDLVDPTRLEDAIDECMAFHGFLLQLFDDISRRDVLDGVPFDRRAAAATLKLYLGD